MFKVGKQRLKCRSEESTLLFNLCHHVTYPMFISQSQFTGVGEWDLRALQNIDNDNKGKGKGHGEGQLVVRRPTYLAAEFISFLCAACDGGSNALPLPQGPLIT